MPESLACANGDHERCNGWWHVFGWKQDTCLCMCHQDDPVMDRAKNQGLGSYD